MGIFDFFKRKKDNTEDIDLEKAVDIKEINESDNSTVNNDTDFKYNFVIDNVEEFHNTEELTPEELKSLITGEILKVVDKSQSFDSMELYAKEAAKVIGIENINALTEYLYGGISKPTALKGRYNGIGAWPNAVKNAVLTILYSFNEHSVDELLGWGWKRQGRETGGRLATSSLFFPVYDLCGPESCFSVSQTQRTPRILGPLCVHQSHTRVSPSEWRKSHSCSLIPSDENTN